MPKKPITSKFVHAGVFSGKGKNCTAFFEDIGRVDNFVASDDLNECVADILLKKNKKG